MNTTILVLLCLALAGRELYMAFEKRRSGQAPAIDEINARLDAVESVRDELNQLKSSHREHIERLETAHAGNHDELREHGESLKETDARIRSLISQINDRMLPEINARLALQQESGERTSADVARLRRHLLRRLDQSVAASLGGEPADTVAGALAAEPADRRDALSREYERCAERYGLFVELAEPSGDQSWWVRYYLSGRSPRALERDFLDLIRALHALGPADSGDPPPETGAARSLLRELRAAVAGIAQIGPLVAVRTTESLLCGVLPLAELRRWGPPASAADPATAAVRLHTLPAERLCDLSGWPRVPVGGGGPGP